MKDENAFSVQLTSDTADAAMVCGIRLLLAVFAVVICVVNPGGDARLSDLATVVCGAYALHSAALFALMQIRLSSMPGKAIYWYDVAWFGLIVYYSGSSNGYVFLLFFFAILAASFQFGFREGSRVTLMSAAALMLVALLAETPEQRWHLLWCTSFLLALGHLIAYWGGMGLQQKRRLALLRDVSRLSNPRFGINHSLSSVLEKNRVFFRASSCILVLQDGDSDKWLLRTATAANAGTSIEPVRLCASAMPALLAFAPEHSVLHARPRLKWWPWMGGTRVLGRGCSKWRRFGGDAGERLVELLEARAFISASLRLRKGQGRVYLMSARHGFSKADALFLKHIVAQVFPMMENIELLDRLASEAGQRERQKIACDLHDSTLQPYIGLRHGISAVRQAAAPENPLIDDLDKLLAMATEVVGDMRHFVKNLNSGQLRKEPELLLALRRQAEQVRQFYDIDIALRVSPAIEVSDRLAAEVFQIVSEGISNIRKHTRARHGAIEVDCSNGWLQILIENEGDGAPATLFTPSSIATRTAALGGRLLVKRPGDGGTSLQIAIPL